jgi:DNA polymerase IV
MLWGLGAAMYRRLAGDDIAVIGQLAMLGEPELATRYGRIGARMAQSARGADERGGNARALAHSISAETTLPEEKPMRRC